MKRVIGPLFAGFITAVLLLAQQDQVRLPSGKNQTEEILKAEHEKSLKDVAEIIRLGEQLKADLEKNEHHILSVNALKKTEEIEKLAKHIRERIRRY
jgi:hypothetical protein